MSKYKKPKVGFLDHVAGKQNDPSLDDLVKNVQESSEIEKKPEPIAEQKQETKQTPIVEEKKPAPAPVDPTMGSYIKATQNDPTSAKGSFDKKITEGYVPPVREEKKPESLKAEKVSAYQKALQERQAKDQKLKEAADLLGGDTEKPVTQADLKQVKVALSALGGGGIGPDEAIRIAKKYAAPLDSDQDSNLQFFLEHFDSVRDVLVAATDYETEDFDSDFNTKSTNDLPEPTAVPFGSDSYNKYFTKERARASIQSIDSAVIFDRVTGNISLDLEALDSLFYTTVDFDSDFGMKTTDSLAEGDSNLYYTDSRARSALSVGDSYIRYDSKQGVFTFNNDLLPNGYTTRDFDSDFLTKNTDSLAEGNSNLYYTDSRARSALSGDSWILYDSLTGHFSFNDSDLPEGYTTADFDSDFDSAIHIDGGIIDRLNRDSDRLDSDEIEIRLLKNKLEALDLNAAIDLQYDKILSFDSNTDSVPRGEYGVHFVGGTDYINVDKFYFNNFDRNNVFVPFDNTDSNDIIIISDSDGGIARYTVTGTADFGNHFRIDVTATLGKGGPADFVNIKLFPQVDVVALAPYTYVDAQDKVLSDRIDDLDSDLDSDHSWAVDKFASLDSTYVNVTGDTMTGDLNVNGGAHVTTRGGNIRAFDGGFIQSNSWKSIGNSNISVSRNNERKMLWGTNSIIADKKVKYNPSYNRDSYTSDLVGEDSYTLMPKWYIDSAIANPEIAAGSFVNVTGDSMTGKLFAPAIQIGPDSDNDGKSILYMEPKDGTVHQLESKEDAAGSVDMDAWISYPSSNELNSWRSVTYGNGKFVAVAYSGTNQVMYSYDGVTWIGAASSNYANSWLDVTYGDGKFVAVAYEGTNRVMYSTDGINWTGVSGHDQNWTGVTYGDGKFVAVSKDGTQRVMYSTDGINWTPADASINLYWNAVGYGGGKFVAVSYIGNQDRAMYSTDGINWTTGTTPSELASWRSVAYGNGMWVAVASSGAASVMYSTDGANWTRATSSDDSNSWRWVIYAAGKFVAVAYAGDGDRVMYSEDGINWTSATSPRNAWYGLTYGDGKFVAVAYSGGSNRVMVLDAPEGRSGLYYDDELIATEVNLQPLINKVNQLSATLDSEQFVSVAGDEMTGQLAISRTSEGSVGLRIKKDDQSRLTIRADGKINWTANATTSVLNKDGGDLSINIDNNLFMRFDRGDEEIQAAKTLTLTGVEKRINLPNNSDVGELTSNKNRRLYWNQNNVGVDVPLLLPGDPTNPLEAATKRYVDANAGGGGNFVALTGDQTVGGSKTFSSNTNVQGYLYLSKSSSRSDGALRRDTIEAMIAAAGGGDYKITKSGSNYYIEAT